MSLQLIAKQMEAKGRKGDSMLVHMTAKEVAALQKMAESAGGSLSVNPETGLVEANFLKRMLPTLVGIGVGAATMNPYLGAAAGAAVGGYQAQRNDQDVLLGAAMGGLGGYGGAGLGAGLTAAGGTTAANVAADAAARTAAEEAAKQAALEQATQQAAQQATEQSAQALLQEQTKNQLIGAATPDITMSGIAPPNLAAQYGATNAGITPMPATVQPMPVSSVAAPKLTASESLSRAGEGIGQLATKEGRTAFGGEFGFGSASAGLAPLMAAGKRPEDPEADDEMYSYTYDPGYTGAENTPSGSSAERRYFDGRFSPVRKIRARDYAAQGGLMSLAEGGETAPAEAAAPTASEAALAYLMGERSSSAPARSPLIDAQLMEGVRPVPMASRAPVVGSDNMYAFDPATGAFLRNPNVPGASTSGSPVGTSFSGSGGSDNVPMSQQTIDFLDRETPPQREARMGEVSNLFSLGPVGAFANAVTGSGLPGRAPDFGTLFGTGDAYKNLGYDYNQAGGYNPSSGQSYAESVGMGGDYGYSGYSSGEDRGEAAGGLITLADGGLMGLAKGGMKSGGFVVPADVVSMIGEGNTDAGYNRIKSMIPGATAIKGKDGGQADTVKTSIEGKQPARVAHGEMYIPPETVKRMGGAKKLYAMMDRVREQATGSKKQIKPVSLKQAMA
jgi:hypothetical protein